jgi:hypothetical protein
LGVSDGCEPRGRRGQSVEVADRIEAAVVPHRERENLARVGVERVEEAAVALRASSRTPFLPSTVEPATASTSSSEPSSPIA